MKDIEELFEIIPNYPAMNLALINDGFLDIKDTFIKFAKEIDASLHIKDTSTALKTKENQLLTEPFDFGQKRYNSHSVLYDFLFLAADTETLELEMVLKKIYRVLKNAAHLFLFCKNEDIDKTIKLLETCNYVAINPVDSYKDLMIISAKKMHGWAKV